MNPCSSSVPILLIKRVDVAASKKGLMTGSGVGVGVVKQSVEVRGIP